MSFHFSHSPHEHDTTSIPAIGLTFQVRVPIENTGGVLTAVETVNAAGTGSPLHRHPQTEIYYVLEGCYLFEVDGKRLVANTGDVVTVPGGAAHRYANIAGRPSRQLIQIVPGIDIVAFFKGLGDVMQSGMPDKNALASFGEHWHVEFLGPPFKTLDLPSEARAATLAQR
jgi:quercetin dioxygenase-like cupin family protein